MGRLNHAAVAKHIVRVSSAPFGQASVKSAAFSGVLVFWLCCLCVCVCDSVQRKVTHFLKH